MRCTLMHKHIAVVEMELDDETGFIRKIYNTPSVEHLPVGVHVRKGLTDRGELNDWWTARSIPASRSGIAKVLETLKIANTKMLLLRCYGLSLSDQYWILPKDSSLTWEDINFFDNPFSDDMGDALFGKPQRHPEFDFSSPDNTSDGCLKKRWKIINGKRVLLKGGSNPFIQQPFNEVIASEIMKRLGIPHVPYTILWDADTPYSVCEDFVTAETELVSAWRVMQTEKKQNSDSMYMHLVRCTEALGIPDIKPMLDAMIVVDFILANEDRHFNNFGFLRNAETLEWIGFAPIFDSGTSLGYDKLPTQIRAERGITCKPFKQHHMEQLKLVTSFAPFDFTALDGIGDYIKEVLSAPQMAEIIDAERSAAIAESVEKRIRFLQSPSFVLRDTDALSTEDDVEEDVAETYTQTPKF